MRRENIFSAHKAHLYQKLHQSGWSHSEVSLLLDNQELDDTKDDNLDLGFGD